MLIFWTELILGKRTGFAADPNACLAKEVQYYQQRRQREKYLDKESTHYQSLKRTIPQVYPSTPQRIQVTWWNVVTAGRRAENTSMLVKTTNPYTKGVGSTNRMWMRPRRHTQWSSIFKK